MINAGKNEDGRPILPTLDFFIDFSWHVHPSLTILDFYQGYRIHARFGSSA